MCLDNNVTKILANQKLTKKLYMQGFFAFEFVFVVQFVFSFGAA